MTLLRMPLEIVLGMKRLSAAFDALPRSAMSLQLVCEPRPPGIIKPIR